MPGALRGVSEEPQRHFRAILEESQRSVMHFGGALEAHGRWQVRHLNTHLRSATEEPQRCLRGALSVEDEFKGQCGA